MEQLTELKCESCSSRDFTRKGDYLICDYCGSKYYSPKPKKEQKAQPQQPAQATYTPTNTNAKAKKRSKLITVITILILFFVAIPTCALFIEDEIETSNYQYVTVEAGETVDLGGCEAVVTHAVGTASGTGSYYNPLYVKIPLTLKATSDVTILREDFDMDDDAYPDDALPESLKLKAGETWSGFLYDDWYYVSDYRNNDRGLDSTHYSYYVSYYNRDKKLSAHWDISVPTGDSVQVDAQSVMSVMPDTVVRLTATYKESFLDSKNPEAVFAMKGTSYDLPVVAAVDSQLKEQLKLINPGDTVILRGTVSALQARVQSSAVINEVVLRNAAIVTG